MNFKEPKYFYRFVDGNIAYDYKRIDKALSWSLVRLRESNGLNRCAKIYKMRRLSNGTMESLKVCTVNYWKTNDPERLGEFSSSEIFHDQASFRLYKELSTKATAQGAEASGK